MLSPSVVLPSQAPSEQITILRVAESVREVHNDDGAVLLDLQQGICFGVTPVGVQIWQLLREGCSVEQICDCLCNNYPDVPHTHIAADVAEFLNDLNYKKLLANGQLPRTHTRFPTFFRFLQKHHSFLGWSSGNPDAPRFLFLKAFLALLAFDVFGFGSNFCRTYEFVRDWNTSVLKDDLHAVDRVCKALNVACVWYPKRVLCLQRSVVTTCLLRRCGVPAQMVMGAQKLPFEAHAWTEVDGQPINERRDVQRYLVWERC